MKKIFIILVLSFMLLSLKGQVRVPASISTEKSWIDKNGENKLHIEINAVYDPYNEDAPTDGHPSKIEVELKNSRYTSLTVYDDKDYEMEVIMFNEDAIWFRQLNGVRVVFIPFFYCCMDNTYTKVSYIILYNKKKYIYHFRFLCEEENDYVPVLIDEDKDLNKKMRKMPQQLRQILIDYIENTYKTIGDVFPQMTQGVNYLDVDSVNN